jgi:Zn ribbon nucleic-acid-binding protein
MKLKTTDIIKEEIYNLVQDEYTVTGSYVNSRIKMKIKHNLCGNEWDVKPHNFIQNGTRCPKCQPRNTKRTTDEFKQEIFELTNGEYEICGEYVNRMTKIKVLHKPCNTLYEVLPRDILNGVGCKKCKGIKISKLKLRTLYDFKLEVYNLVGDEYKIIGEYVNSKTKILMHHTICNNTYEVTPKHFSQGSRCPSCNKGIVKTHEQFCKEVYDMVGDEYEVLSNYINSYTDIKLKHTICNCEYKAAPSNFLAGTCRCPECNESKGERKIRQWLLDNNILFERQFTFNDCKNINLLPFDFATFKNNNLYYIIEYDGIFHYKPLVGEKKLYYRKKLDKIKTDYCNKNNIKLLRIPYWEFDNIETILKKELNLI